MHHTKRGRGARCRRASWSHGEEQAALRHPETRRAMDVLCGMLRLDQVSATLALSAIERDAHRGWIDGMLAAHEEHVRWGIEHRWREVLWGCVGQVGVGDLDVREAIEDTACDAREQNPILRTSYTSLPAPARRSAPIWSFARGLSCPVHVPARARHVV